MLGNSMFCRMLRMALVSFAASAVLGVTGCGSDGGEATQLESTGTAQIPLSSWSANGTMYRLTGTFAVTGPENQTVTSSGDEPSVKFQLVTGSYQVALSSWRLYEVQKNNTLKELTTTAVLTSQNPLPFDIVAGASTPLKFAFDLSGTALPFGEGEAEVEIEVTPPQRKVQVTAGGSHNCILLKDGAVRCWGANNYGQLGYGNTNTIGDDELPNAVGAVWLNGTAKAIDAGGNHTCAIMDNGTVKCWGYNASGQLGYGNTNTIGDNELAGSQGSVALIGKAQAITAGSDHTCALMESGAVRCWGANGSGQLGYGHTNTLGDNETLSTLGDVELGGRAVAVSAGTGFTCALLESGVVRCWGLNNYGQLGHGHTNNVGDNEAPAIAGDVELGQKAVAIDAGGAHACAVVNSGGLRCWGADSNYQLGIGDQGSDYGLALGDNELPLSKVPIAVGGPVAAVAAGAIHTCALLTTGQVVCWGSQGCGRLGYGSIDSTPNTQPPSIRGFVPVSPTGTSITASAHTCLLTSSNALYCWGTNTSGQLGYTNTQSFTTCVGDTEKPSSMGPVIYQ